MITHQLTMTKRVRCPYQTGLIASGGEGSAGSFGDPDCTPVLSLGATKATSSIIGKVAGNWLTQLTRCSSRAIARGFYLVHCNIGQLDSVAFGLARDDTARYSETPA